MSKSRCIGSDDDFYPCRHRRSRHCHCFNHTNSQVIDDRIEFNLGDMIRIEDIKVIIENRPVRIDERSPIALVFKTPYFRLHFKKSIEVLRKLVFFFFK